MSSISTPINLLSNKIGKCFLLNFNIIDLIDKLLILLSQLFNSLFQFLVLVLNNPEFIFKFSLLIFDLMAIFRLLSF